MISRQFVTVGASVCAPSTSARSDVAMRQSWVSVGQKRGLLPTDVGQRLVHFLRSLYPSGTAKNVARDTGLTVASVEKLLERQSAPNSAGFVAFTLAYGPDFLGAVLPRAPAWLDRAMRAERQADLENKIEAAQRELEELRR